MLDHYHAMVRLSRQMLEAASRADWAQLVELGQQRDAVEAQLRAYQDGAPSPQLGGEQEQQLMAAVLEANAQIKLLVDKHLASLQEAAEGGDAALPA
jgi:hypothetical protein